jgi:ribokinase
MTRVVVVGSLNMDATVDVAQLPRPGETVLGRQLTWSPGGKGANQAVAAARQGVTTALIGRVGDDDAGRSLLALLEAEGVDTTGLSVTSGTPTGVALIAVDGTGTNMIVVVPSANLALTVEDVDAAAAVIATASVLVCQLEVPLDAVERALRLARAAGVTTILNPSPVRPIAREVLELVDILVANEHEMVDLRAQGRLPCGAVVATMGERGAELVQGAGRTTIEAAPVAAVDTTGAGDAFLGALAAGLAAERPLADALRRAVAAGAVAVTRPGALLSMPDAAEVTALLEEAR